MTQTIPGTKDFLEASPNAVGSNQDELARLMAEQVDYLADIALAMKRLTADVLTFAVVKGTSQLNNAIVDTGSHQVRFELAGKPVSIYKLLVFSTYDQTITLSFENQPSPKDGMVFTASTPPLYLPLTLETLYIQATALSASLLPINGPVDLTHGGFYIYGFTIPDYYRVRGAIRSS
jgi:hypothetical protein